MVALTNVLRCAAVAAMATGIAGCGGGGDSGSADAAAANGPRSEALATDASGTSAVVRLQRYQIDPAKVFVAGISAGGFAAVSALLGSPLLGAFLLMEASGLGGATATVVLLPGLLAAGIGALVFILPSCVPHKPIFPLLPGSVPAGCKATQQLHQ